MRVISAEEFAAHVDLVPVLVGESVDGRFMYYEGTAIGRNDQETK